MRNFVYQVPAADLNTPAMIAEEIEFLADDLGLEATYRLDGDQIEFTATEIDWKTQGGIDHLRVLLCR